MPAPTITYVAGSQFEKGTKSHISFSANYDSTWSASGLPAGLEIKQPLQDCTISATGSVVTCVGHGFENGEHLTFPTLVGGVGLNTSTFYYVKNATQDTFVIATSNAVVVPVTTSYTAGSKVRAYQGFSRISGTATESGLFPATLSATYDGDTATMDILIVVGAASPWIAPHGSLVWIRRNAMSVVSLASTDAAAVWSAQTSLPAGVTISEAGVITCEATADPGCYTATIRASNANGFCERDVVFIITGEYFPVAGSPVAGSVYSISLNPLTRVCTQSSMPLTAAPGQFISLFAATAGNPFQQNFVISSAQLVLFADGDELARVDAEGSPNWFFPVDFSPDLRGSEITGIVIATLSSNSPVSGGPSANPMRIETAPFTKTLF